MKIVSDNKLIAIILFQLQVYVYCINENNNIDEHNQKSDSMKALSRSKASVWVDTNRGSVFSTSIGSSHVDGSNKSSHENSGLNGRSNNMLLTLLLQPQNPSPVSAVPQPTEEQESHLKPILLLLQQQQDLSELLLEKEEKIEKMNVHLQQQIKHQQRLIVDLLEQIKLLLEVINSPAVRQSDSRQSVDTINYLKERHLPNNDLHQTSASSSANALVTVPRKKSSEIYPNNNINNNAINKDVDLKSAFIRKKIPPILVSSESEVIDSIRLIDPQLLTNHSLPKIDGL